MRFFTALALVSTTLAAPRSDSSCSAGAFKCVEDGSSWSVCDASGFWQTGGYCDLPAACTLDNGDPYCLPPYGTGRPPRPTDGSDGLHTPASGHQSSYHPSLSYTIVSSSAAAPTRNSSRPPFPTPTSAQSPHPPFGTGPRSSGGYASPTGKVKQSLKYRTSTLRV
ncbi:hypothetical protein F5Y15DRAFT_236917 [Xylariaceae sp. FL0016]|nr:hypothetical protein F5Y15DRAFT_236917 [Xylariaceae sp. FL0016]